VFLLVGACLGGDKYAPLPKRLLEAKTVFLVNTSARVEVLDQAYKELKSWGRFVVADDQSKADLILVLTAKQTGETVSTIKLGNDTATTSSQVNGYGQYATVTSTTKVNRAPEMPITSQTGITTLQVFDHTTPEAPAIWAIEREWSASGSGKQCIKELKKRIEYQEKEAKQKEEKQKDAKK
jgi:hypothetical protein